MNVLDIARKYLKHPKEIDSQSLSPPPAPPSAPPAIPTACGKSGKSGVSPPDGPSAEPAGSWIAPDADPDALASPFLPENAELLAALDRLLPPRV